MTTDTNLLVALFLLVVCPLVCLVPLVIGAWENAKARQSMIDREIDRLHQ
jgi:hypothetical protein